MDEQTFRRLAPDAVAGRLDSATYERWKAAAAEDPSRGTFVVRIAEADARLSARRPADVGAPAALPPVRVPRKRVFGLAVTFALLGLLAGGLVMHSYLKNREQKAQTNANIVGDRPAKSPAPNAPANNRPPVNTPASNSPQPEPEPEPVEPEPVPKDPVETLGLRLVSSVDKVSVRGPRSADWLRLQPGEGVPAEYTVSVAAAARFRSAEVEIFCPAAAQFELVNGAIHFTSGRAAVRVSGGQAFSCYRQVWSTKQAGFIIEPKRLGGELFIVEGAAIFGDTEITAPSQVALDGTRTTTVLTPAQIVQLEQELIGPHRRLLYWDCESGATSPEMGEFIQPGALGDGLAVRRKLGQPGVGVAPSTEVFKAESGARLRLRVKTTASTIRIELRVKLDTGFRVVDSRISVQRNDSWQVIDVPLDVVRAGRFRSEPGWLPGYVYSAFLLSPGVNPESPLTRHEFVIDDLLVYVPDGN